MGFERDALTTVCFQGPVMVLQDSTGALIPLEKDSLGGVKEPIWLVSMKSLQKL
jgi:hypothetical protein